MTHILGLVGGLKCSIVLCNRQISEFVHEVAPETVEGQNYSSIQNDAFDHVCALFSDCM
jgi:hypothetical protein